MSVQKHYGGHIQQREKNYQYDTMIKIIVLKVYETSRLKEYRLAV